jgi:hypothetical protein
VSDESAFALSLVRDDPPLRIQRRLGLVPAGGLGVARRAIVLAGFSFLPLAVWALVAGRWVGAGEPLLQHFGVTVRCLVAIPLLVVAEGVAHGVTTRLLPHFVRSGLVGESELPRFRQVLFDVTRLRDRSLPWVLILAAAFAVQALGRADDHGLVWASSGEGAARFAFGGFWFRWVVRPLFVALLVGWLWRLFLLAVLFRRIARLDLALVPTHPDGAAGLGFLETIPFGFAPVAFAISTVLASQWAHDVLYHGVHVGELRMPMIATIVAALLLFLSPLLLWRGVLAPAKRQALLDYGALVGEHGRLVRARWILGESPRDDALLGAQEIGPVADTVTLYETVRKMRVFPIGRTSMLAILLAVGVPFLPVLAIEIPIRDLLMKVLGALA